MIYSGPGATVKSSAIAATGLTGTIGVRIIAGGATVVARATAGIVEYPAGSGVYEATLTAPTTAGQYTIVWDDGSATPTHISAQELVVSWSGPSSPLSGGNPVDLCTVDQVKAALEPPITTTARDPRIQELITDASLAIIKKLDRELTPKTSGATRRVRVDLDGGGDGWLVDLAPYDLRTATLVKLHPESASPITLAANADYALEPLGAPQGSFKQIRLSNYLWAGSAFSRSFGYALLDVTGDWGIWDTADVPVDVREACVLTVRSWLRQNPGAYAFKQDEPLPAGMSPAPPETWSIPPGALKKLSPYQRWVV